MRLLTRDLPVLGLRTEPSGEIAYGTDGGVAGAFGKPDLAQCGVTPRDARAETKFRAMATPNSNQLARRFADQARPRVARSNLERSERRGAQPVKSGRRRSESEATGAQRRK